MRFCDIIDKKKLGEELSYDELYFAVNGFLEGTVPDYQMSALLMAICFMGMTDREIADLTMITAKSGQTLDLSRFGTRSVDKHSTGGVGDKTTLIVAPIVAAAGGVVAKMSGRGLGHTGGTVDKLESIPGYRVDLTTEEFFEISEKTGLSVISANKDLAPADKKLYALRDVTSTVNSIPLIVASIMGKKLSAGCHNIVLDVKYGSGAFMKTPEDAEILGQKMVDIGKACKKNIRAVITDMDVPLGRTIGNLSEVQEAYSLLGGHDEGLEDLKTVCLTLSANMLSLVHGISVKSAYTMAENALVSGKALEKFKEMVMAHSGSISKLEELLSNYSTVVETTNVISPKDGYISALDAEALGITALNLGAGRLTKDTKIDYLAGITLVKKPGDFVKKGDLIAKLYSTQKTKLIGAEDAFMKAVSFSEKPINLRNIIYKTLS
ncbi:MAG: thymidine phosphorylase [Ruminococcaceae bacterium]|nr:thymidine phosphorylase [Oscillospiraceae bacterium]